MKADLILDAKAELGEGALWHDGRLLWVDIEGHTANRFDPASGRNQSWNLGQRVGTVVPRTRGGLVAAVHHGVGFLDTDTGDFEIFADPEGGRDELRFNDGKCDPHGRLFAGTMGITKPRAAGTLFCIGPDLSTTPLLGGLGTSNGLAWSGDGETFYFIDTPTLEVSAFDFDAGTGNISNRRVAVRFPDGDGGKPDGMTIDIVGNLWVALWGGAGVVCCDPRSGRILERIDVPSLQTTSCAFGGPDLCNLYITSARMGLDDAELETRPHSGGIFVARPGVAGVPAFSFAG